MSAEIHFFEHLQTADRDKPVHCDARAAHYAFGNGVDHCDKGSKERENHTTDCRREDGDGGGVFADCNAAYRFPICGICAPAEESADDGADAVAQQRSGKAGIFNEVHFNNGTQVLMMSDVLSQLDDCNRREQESNIENGGRIDGIAVCRFKGPEKSKFGIIQKTGKFDLTEFIDKKAGNQESACIPPRQLFR